MRINWEDAEDVQTLIKQVGMPDLYDMAKVAKAHGVSSAVELLSFIDRIRESRATIGMNRTFPATSEC